MIVWSRAPLSNWTTARRCEMSFRLCAQAQALHQIAAPMSPGGAPGSHREDERAQLRAGHAETSPCYSGDVNLNKKPGKLAHEVAEGILSAIFGPDLIGCQITPDAITPLIQEALDAHAKKEETVNALF